MKHLDHLDVFQLCVWRQNCMFLTRHQDEPETTAHDSVSTFVSMKPLNMFNKTSGHCTFSVSGNKTETSMKPLDVFK